MTEMGINQRFTQEKTAKTYEAYYETKYKRADLLEKKILTQLFAQFPQAKNVLEVGCGTAHFTRWMQHSLSLEAIGVDASKAMLKEAKKHWPKGALMLGEAANLPVKDKSVDVAVFITSLEFISDAEAAIEEAARIAKRGIVLGLINKNSVGVLKKKFQAATHKNSFYRQAKFYSQTDIERMLDRVVPEGYEIALAETSVFPKVFGDVESSVLPLGDFLGLAVKLRNTNG
jgi:ubiquinone/menaquinone biosynthesis C-methylase UbiE